MRARSLECCTHVEALVSRRLVPGFFRCRRAPDAKAYPQENTGGQQPRSKPSRESAFLHSLHSSTRSIRKGTNFVHDLQGHEKTTCDPVVRLLMQRTALRLSGGR